MTETCAREPQPRHRTGYHGQITMIERLLATCFTFVAALTANARAQPIHQVNLYSDPAHTTKYAQDNAPGVLIVYVVHEAQPIVPNVTVATSLDFKIVQSSGFTGVWASESTTHLFLGSSPAGIRFAYGGCLELPTRVLEVQYATFGTSEECSYLEVVGHPDQICGSNAICAFDCDFEYHVPIGGRLYINPNAQCSVPIAPTTWGKIKSLYR